MKHLENFENHSKSFSDNYSNKTNEQFKPPVGVGGPEKLEYSLDGGKTWNKIQNFK